MWRRVPWWGWALAGTALTAAVLAVLAAWTSIIPEMFSWPDGIVVGNLIASAMWAAPALVHLHKKLDAQHAEHMAQMARLHKHLGVPPDGR